jgi:hypothetical protein
VYDLGMITLNSQKLAKLALAATLDRKVNTLYIKGEDGCGKKTVIREVIADSEEYQCEPVDLESLVTLIEQTKRNAQQKNQPTYLAYESINSRITPLMSQQTLIINNIELLSNKKNKDCEKILLKHLRIREVKAWNDLSLITIVSGNKELFDLTLDDELRILLSGYTCVAINKLDDSDKINLAHYWSLPVPQKSVLTKNQNIIEYHNELKASVFGLTNSSLHEDDIHGGIMRVANELNIDIESLKSSSKGKSHVAKRLLFASKVLEAYPNARSALKAEYNYTNYLLKKCN